MRTILVFLFGLSTAGSALGDNYTKPYVRSDGTYVQGHMSSEPNQYRFDNYSGRGNVNPYTQERGSQRHEFTDPPAYNLGRGHQQTNPGGGPNTYGNTMRDPYNAPRNRQR